jgi:DNA-directed RNA polymerase subunit RPC12/RpoP
LEVQVILMQYDVMKEMLKSTVIVNYIQPDANRGINRISEGPSQVIRPSSRLTSYAGTPYDFENPSCGSWGPATEWVTQLRNSKRDERGSWNPRRNHFGGLLPELEYIVTDGRDASDFRYVNGPQQSQGQGQEMRLTCTNCGVNWVRSVRQSAAGYGNRCPGCGSADRFTEVGTN